MKDINMYKLKRDVIRDNNISPEVQAKIVKLHQKFFDLDKDKIIELLMAYEEIHLYVDTSNQRLVGTIGFKWVDCGEFITMYLGSTVVDPDYQKYGFLTTSIYLSVLKTIIKYPRQHKCVVALATTPDAYSYFKRLKNYWPKPDEDIPEHIVNKMKVFCDIYCSDHYRKNKNGLIIAYNSGQFDVDVSLLSSQKCTKNMHSIWFEKNNPGFKKGEQLVCLVEFDGVNVRAMTKVYFKKIIRLFWFDHIHHDKRTHWLNLIKMGSYAGVFMLVAYEMVYRIF